MPQPQFEISPDARKLAEFLEKRDRATYAEMSRLTGRIVNGRDRYVLAAALRTLQRQNVVFVCERGIGVVRATNDQVAMLSTDHIHNKTRRVIKRGKKLERVVNTQKLSADERDAFFIGSAVTQMLDATVGRKIRSRIANEIKERNGEQVEVSDLIALFRKRAH